MRNLVILVSIIAIVLELIAATTPSRPLRSSTPTVLLDETELQPLPLPVFEEPPKAWVDFRR